MRVLPDVSPSETLFDLRVFSGDWEKDRVFTYFLGQHERKVLGVVSTNTRFFYTLIFLVQGPVETHTRPLHLPSFSVHNYL